MNPFRNGELWYWRSHRIGLREGALGCSIQARIDNLGVSGPGTSVLGEVRGGKAADTLDKIMVRVGR
jgi:hypothetical protein